MLCMALCFLLACKKELPKQAIETAASSSSTQYAKGFDLVEKEGHRYLYLFRHYQKSIDTLCYLLYDRNSSSVPEGDFQAKIAVPVQKTISLSSPYSAMMEALGELDALTAISQADFIYSPELLKLVEDGSVGEIGPDAKVDVESTLSLAPDLLLYSAFPGSVSKNLEQLESLGVPCLPLAEWQETTLLGRAEWIKVMGSLFAKKKEADSLFSHISQVYQELKEKVSRVEKKPKILSSLPFKGIWSVPGGQSYMAKAFADAGADYHWKDQQQTASLPLSFEAVYPVAMEAEIWLGPGAVTSYEALAAQDDRFLEFMALKNKKVYHYYKRSHETGGNDYWESGVINPHLILSDFIKILHPDLLPEHNLVFFGELAE